MRAEQTIAERLHADKGDLQAIHDAAVAGYRGTVDDETDVGFFVFSDRSALFLIVHDHGGYMTRIYDIESFFKHPNKKIPEC